MKRFECVGGRKIFNQYNVETKTFKVNKAFFHKHPKSIFENETVSIVEDLDSMFKV